MRRFAMIFAKYFVFVGAPLYAFGACSRIISAIPDISFSMLASVWFLGVMFVIGCVLGFRALELAAVKR
jgi:hypothetical protein